MINYICYAILLFFVYSFIGWCFEVLLSFWEHKKFINRGFLIGPLCPIYGVGCLLIIGILRKYSNDPFIVFFMNMILCSVLEYFTSYLMEKIFKARWWDYSERHFNINGRICLEGASVFGIGGLLVLCFINPFFMMILHKFNDIVLYTLVGILSIIFIIDLIFSFKVISGFKNMARSINKDNTEEITKRVRDMLIKKGGVYKRLAFAFNFKVSSTIKELKEKVKEEQRKIKEQKDKLTKEYKEKTRELKEKAKKIKKKND